MLIDLTVVDDCRKMSAMSESDRPRADTSAPKDDNEDAKATENEEESQKEEEEEEADTHCCCKCKLVFTSLEAYIQHKLTKDNCKMVFTKSPRDRRVLIPRFLDKVKAGDTQKGTQNETDNAGEPARPKRRRKKKSLQHEAENIIERPVYTCKSCDKTFRREAALKQHVRYQHDEVAYDSEGEIISKDDTSKETPEETPGDDERPFQCKVCERRFKEVNVLKTHMLTHSEQRDFPCTWPGCSYAFKTKGSQKRHMRRHTGERPYRCTLCGRCFGESGALNRHMKSRTPCTAKSDADLPRYGKRIELNPQEMWDRNAPKAVEGEEVLLATVGHDGTLITVETVDMENVDPAQTPADTEVPEEGESTEVETAAGDGSKTVGAEVVLDNDFECKVCHLIAENAEGLQQHLRSHLADTPFRCGLCTFATAKKDDLNLHMQVRHQTKLKESQPEDKTLPKEAVEVTEGTEVTETVTTDSETTGIVQEEIVTQEESEQVVDKEEQSRNAAIALQQLLQLQEATPKVTQVQDGVHGFKTLHKCPVCSRSFRGSSYLRLHMRSHTGERPHKCMECPKSFASKDTLNKHMCSHSEMRQYKCGECGKMFKRISHVREHLKIHSNERPYSCSICDKSFKTSNACKVHLRTHTNCMPFDCKFCHRRFREKGSLERHVRTHTGERPFQCRHCGRAFAEHGTLNRHLKAKVPCTRQLQQSRQEEEEMVEEMEEMPTVLAEFSSVVADTQQYILQAEDPNTEQTTEYVISVGSGDPKPVQNIEIVMQGDGTGVADLEGTEFVLVNHDADKITVLNQRTGETLDMLSTGVEVVSTPQEEAVQAVAMIPPHSDQIEAVAMAPTSSDADAVQQAMMVANVVAEQEHPQS